MYRPNNSGIRLPRYTNPPMTEQPSAWLYSRAGRVVPAGSQFTDGEKHAEPSNSFPAEIHPWTPDRDDVDFLACVLADVSDEHQPG